MASNTDADTATDTCAGTTTDGTPCGNPAGDDGYCWLHGPEDDPADDEEEPVEEATDDLPAVATAGDAEPAPVPEPETIRVASDTLGYVAPGLRFEQRHAVHEVERTAAIDEALEQGRIRRVGERN